MAANVVVEMTGSEERLYRSMQRVVTQQSKMEGGFKRVGKAGRDAGKAFSGKKMADNLKASALQLTGIAGGLATVVGLTKSWLAAQDKIGESILKATDDYLAFSIIQEKGTKRAATIEALQKIASAGIGREGRGEALLGFQGLQSAIPDGAAEAFQTVLNAKLAGVEVKDSLKLETLAISKGFDPNKVLQ